MLIAGAAGNNAKDVVRTRHSPDVLILRTLSRRLSDSRASFAMQADEETSSSPCLPNKTSPALRSFARARFYETRDTISDSASASPNDEGRICPTAVGRQDFEAITP